MSARLLRDRRLRRWNSGRCSRGLQLFYTPRLLVIDLVRHALAPLVVRRTAAEIEKLRVIDAACGSAHFLVEAMRFLGRELHHAYVDEYGGAPPQFESTTGLGWDNDSRASDEEARAANSEARAETPRRHRCAGTWTPRDEGERGFARVGPAAVPHSGESGHERCEGPNRLTGTQIAATPSLRVRP